MTSQLAQEPALSHVLTTCAAKEETQAAPNGLPTWVLRYCKVCCPIQRPLRLWPTPSSDFTLTFVPTTDTVASPLQGGLSLVGTSPLQGGLSQSTSPLQGGLPKSASPLQGGLPPTNTFTITQTVVNNDGCNVGTVSTSSYNETQIAVESVVRLAEAHHHQKVVTMADSATQEHHQRMATLRAHMPKRGTTCLVPTGWRTHPRPGEAPTRFQNSHILAQKEQGRVAMVARAYCSNQSPMHSSPESGDYLDGISNAGSIKSQVGYVASLANNFVSPFQKNIREYI